MHSTKVYGLDIEEFTPAEICEKVGVSRFGDYQLIESIEESYQMIQYARKHLDRSHVRQAALQCCVCAYEAYRRYYNNHYPIHRNSYNDPNTIEFWTDPSNIIELYEFMKADGIFQKKSDDIKKELKDLEDARTT